MNADIIKIAKQFTTIVKKKYNNKRTILFGSYAKRTNTRDSDIDIAVVFKDYDDSIDMQLQLMGLRRKIDSRILPHPFKEIDFSNSNPLANETIKYGYEIR